MIGSKLGSMNMLLEKRKYTRTDIFLIIHFRLVHNLYEYAVGISRNYSDEGFCMESQNFDCRPGQILECTVKHPESDSSVSILGEIVWKKDGWYNAVMGVQFLHTEEKTVKALREMLHAGRKKRSPVCAGGPASGGPDGNGVRNMSTHKTTSQKTAVRAASNAKTTQAIPPQTGHSVKSRRSYYRFFLFLLASSMIILSIMAGYGKDVFRWADLARQKAESLLPVRNQNSSPAAIASFGVSATTDNVRKSPDEKSVAAHKASSPGDIVREEIMFDVNSDDISPEFRSEIDKVADILLGSPLLNVKLEGHTDNAGSELYNMDLSIRRVAAVRNELINRGIDAARIKIVCFGQSSPAAPNDAESGRMKNRRVEISIPLSQS
jgi:outer membrane protein OmpA-like peptidoglycan-associated protein